MSGSGSQQGVPSHKNALTETVQRGRIGGAGRSLQVKEDGKGSHRPAPHIFEGTSLPPFPEAEGSRGVGRRNRGGLRFFAGHCIRGNTTVGSSRSAFAAPKETWGKQGLTACAVPLPLTLLLPAPAAEGGLRPNRPCCRQDMGADMLPGGGAEPGNEAVGPVRQQPERYKTSA